MIDINRYQSMAKLSLSESERARISNHADILVKSFDELEKINVDNASPLISVLNESNILREDIPRKFTTREELLSYGPEQSDGYFQVPKTID